MLRIGEKRHNGAVRRALPALLLLAAAFPAPAAAAPIPDGPDGGPGDFTGAPFDTRPLRSPTPPRHPFMAPNDRSNLHQDAYQTDTSRGLGPLGHGMTQTSTLKTADCGSVTFDSRGRIVTICVGLLRPTLVVMDPNSLATIEEMPLPLRTAERQPLPGLHRRRLLLPRPPRPRRVRHHRAPHHGRGGRARRAGLVRHQAARSAAATASSPRCRTGPGGSGSRPRAASWAGSIRAPEPSAAGR